MIKLCFFLSEQRFFYIFIAHRTTWRPRTHHTERDETKSCWRRWRGWWWWWWWCVRIDTPTNVVDTKRTQLNSSQFNSNLFECKTDELWCCLLMLFAAFAAAECECNYNGGGGARIFLLLLGMLLLLLLLLLLLTIMANVFKLLYFVCFCFVLVFRFDPFDFFDGFWIFHRMWVFAVRSSFNSHEFTIEWNEKSVWKM